MSDTTRPTPPRHNTEAQWLFTEACTKHQEGDLDNAAALYRQAVKTDPSEKLAWRNLGALLRQQGEITEARHCTEQALKLDSSDGSLWGNYGNVLRDQGNLEASAEAFREGIKREPKSRGLLLGLVISMGKLGEHKKVIDLLRPIVEETKKTREINDKDDEIAELLLELGNAHHALGHLDLALENWQEGIHGAKGEKKLFIGLNIAQVLCGLKKLAEAEDICSDLVELFPKNENLTYARGVIAKGQGKIDKAIELFEQALIWNPAYPICLNTYGLLLRELGKTHQARECFEQAIAHDQSFGAAMNNLGSVLKDVARYSEALMWLRKGAESLRDNPAAHSNVLFTLVGYELEPADKRFEEAKRFAQRFGNHPFERWRDGVTDPSPTRTLKIGLISPDFCRHAVSYFIEPLLEQWNKNKLEITLYSCGEQIDDYSARLRKKADHWVDFKTAGVEECIQKIQSDEIDILIDLAGHTAGNRLAVLAAKPAPIQATYLGYYGTTGLTQVDYWITDETLHPSEKNDNDPSTEKKWRLNRCYVSYRPLAKAPAVQQIPCKKNGRITFGSFNQSRKITPQTAKHWIKVLNAVPRSRLLLKSKNLGEKTEQERVRTMFENMGLRREDLELRGHSASVEEHMGEYKDIDIALDTYPYTGCTTTADALWMGVPVLTVAGSSMVSRQASAVLSGAGKQQWICDSGEMMAEQARILCSDIEKLAINRQQQRREISESSLLNHKELAENLEQTFRHWWHQWLQTQGYTKHSETILWEQKNEINKTHMATSITNSPALQVPLWLGDLSEENKKRLKKQNKTVIKLESLMPWGEAVKIFGDNHRCSMMAWIEEGVDTEQELQWNKIYPQLKWNKKGPLAQA